MNLALQMTLSFACGLLIAVLLIDVVYPSFTTTTADIELKDRSILQEQGPRTAIPEHIRYRTTSMSLVSMHASELH